MNERQADALDHLRDDQKERSLNLRPSQIASMHGLFDLAESWNVGTLYLHESRSPGAAESLRTWATSRGYDVLEQVIASVNRSPYVNLIVDIPHGSIGVIVYRDATEAEIAGLVQP